MKVQSAPGLLWHSPRSDLRRAVRDESLSSAESASSFVE